MEATVEVKLSGSPKIRAIEEKIGKFQEKWTDSQEKIMETQASITQKVNALGTGMNFCMSLCKILMTGVSEKASTSEIAHMRNEIETHWWKGHGNGERKGPERGSSARKIGIRGKKSGRSTKKDGV